MFNFFGNFGGGGGAAAAAAAAVAAGSSAAAVVPPFAPWLEGLRLRSQGRQEEACIELRGLLESLPSTTLSVEHVQASYVALTLSQP